ncbi:MAG: translocation/assembly module TamB domain-containing protein [Bacteriovoracia bacterium]
MRQSRQPKRILYVFLATVGGLVVGAILLVQSARFAETVKRALAKHVPKEWGISGDFKEFRVHFFPPGLSVTEPKVRLAEGNVLDLPPGIRVDARRIDLLFFPLQMLSGKIRVHEVLVVDGNISVSIDPKQLGKTKPKERGAGLSFRWEDLVRVQADALAFQNTKVDFEWVDPHIEAGFLAKDLRIAQWRGRGGAGVELALELERIAGRFPEKWKVPAGIENLKAVVNVSSQGVQIRQFKLKSSGLSASVTGGLKGNLLEPKRLLLDSTVDIFGECDNFLDFFRLQEKAAGQLGFKGSIVADLTDFDRTVQAKGLVTGKDFAFRQWKTDFLMAEAEWAPTREIVVTRVELQSKEIDRQGSRSPAHGGKLEIGSFRINPRNPTTPITVPVKFERAHLHWFLPDAMKDVYPLNFRVSGIAKVEYRPGPKWELATELHLDIPDFRYDNQRFGVEKPLRHLLKIGRLRLDGGVRVNARELRPDGLQMSMGSQTNFQVGGSIDFKTGYGLRAQGKVDLADVGTISENPVRGVGELKVHVHGPSSHVYIDFDTAVKDAQYLGLNLGDLNGRITWDDGPEELLFDKVNAKQGQTAYIADGKIELGDVERLGLGFSIVRGDLQDFFFIFNRLVEPISWFPSSLTGGFYGKVELSGGVSNAEMVIDSQLIGKDWDYLGEKFSSVSIKGGYDRGRYHISDLRAVKNRGEIHGSISYRGDGKSEEQLKWNLKTSALTLSDLDHVARLDVPLKGEVEISSNGEMQKGFITSRSLVQLNDPTVRGVRIPSSHLQLDTERGLMKLNGVLNGGQAEVKASYGFKPGTPSRIHASLRKLDFSPVLLLLNPKLIQDAELVGTVTGSIDLDFESNRLEHGDGKVEFTEWVLGKSGSRFQLVKPVGSRIVRGQFDLGDVRITGGDGTVRASVRGTAEKLVGSLGGELDIRIAEFLTSSITRANGNADLDIQLSGKLKEPVFVGVAILKGAQLQIPSLDNPFEAINGAFKFKQNVVSVKDLRAKLAGGSVLVNGEIELYPDRMPKLKLDAQLQENRLKIYPFQVAKVEGTLGVFGDRLPYQVDGNIHLMSAVSHENILDKKTGGIRKSAKFTPPPGTLRDSDYPTFKLNINVNAEDEVVVKNDLFDAELKAKVKIVNTTDVPRLLGSADVIRGTLNFKDRSFQIDSGRVDFDNPTVLDPKFSLTARTEVKSTKIKMYASGTSSKMTIELTSDPVLPQAEILSLLALGFTTEDMQRFRAGDQATLQQGQGASLLLDSFGFNRDVKNKTGFEIQLDQAVSTQEGTSIFRRSSEAEAGASPKIVIKRRIGKQLDVSYGSTVGVGTGSSQEGKVEVHDVVPGVSVIGIWTTFEDANTKDKDSYGIDLKYEKKFK